MLTGVSRALLVALAVRRKMRVSAAAAAAAGASVAADDGGRTRWICGEKVSIFEGDTTSASASGSSTSSSQ